MSMEFFVYNNIHDLDNRIPKNEHNRIDVKKVLIFKKNNVFWFETDYDFHESHVNVNKPFLHIHKGITSLNDMKFNEDPFIADKIIYNPKSRCIEIKDSIWPWKKPIYWKKSEHIGILPEKKTKVEAILFNHSKKHMYFILNFFPMVSIYDLDEEELSMLDQGA